MTQKIRQDIVTYYQRIFQHGLAAGTSGNISCYDHDADIMWITPSSVDPFSMTEEDIVGIDLDGNLREATQRRPSSEWKMHAAIYRNLPEAKAVVHTHSPYATAFSVLNRSVPFILLEMSAFTEGSIPVSAFGPNGSTELAEHVVETLKGRHSCLMERHGVVAYGHDLASAFLRVSYVEDAAKISGIVASINYSNFDGRFWEEKHVSTG